MGNDPVNLVDPEGLWIPQVIGAIMGAGVEWWQNGFGWNVAVGALTGALGGFGSSVVKSALYGAAGNVLNNLYHQYDASCKTIDWKEVGKSAAYGATGGYFGGAIGNLGKNIKDYSRATSIIINVRYPTVRWEGPIGNYGRSGAAIGAIAGGVIANGGWSW